MFIVAETVMGNLRFISPGCMALNVIIYYMLYMGVYTIFRTTKYGWPLLNLLLYLLALVEYFVISFRERPAMIWDVLAIRTAMTVSANYNYTVTPTLAVAFFIMAALSIWAWRCPKALQRDAGFVWEAKTGPMVEGGTEAWRKHVRETLAGASWFRAVRPWQIWAAGSAVFLYFLFTFLATVFRLDVPMWDPVVSFEKEGVVLSTVLSFKSVVPPKPDGYSTAAAERLMADIDAKNDGNEEKSGSGGAEPVDPVNVICIMNESFSDLRLFQGLSGGSFETDEPFLEYYDSLSEDTNTQKGTLYVPVFGAMTANSEYEFLTGSSCAFVPQGSIPYQFFTKKGDISLARIFGGQGYETIAMHPYPGYNWNRTEAYENLGFDRFLDQDFYDNLEGELEFTKPRGYMSDQSDFEAILYLLREKDPNDKLFLFNVTMQNHGGYEVDGLESTVHVTKLNGKECEGEYPKADQYLTLMRMSDEALEYFLTELKKMDEPTMVVMFGDHQPSVETSFFEALYGMRWTEVPDALKINSFKTPYIIWTNYDREAKEAGDMSAFMLGSEVLKEAGIPRTGLFAAAESLRENYDAVHAMGVLEKGGTFSDGMEQGVYEGFPDVRNFHILQYYEIFDKQ